MCGGGPSNPPTPPPPAPLVETNLPPKKAKGRRRTQDSATFSRSAVSRMYAPQGTLMSTDIPDTGKTLLGS